MTGKELNANGINMLDQILDTIMQSDVWAEIKKEDPLVKQSDEEMQGVLENIRPLISQEEYFRLEDAAYSYATAIEGPAVLYGIYVADILREASASPISVSQRIVDRMSERKKS